MPRPSRRLAVAALLLAATAGLAVSRDWTTDLTAVADRARGGRASSEAAALTDEAIKLYAAGHYARACDRFRTAAEHDPASTARREDAWRCFEGWGWQALADGRAAEAVALFRQGLRDAPDSPDLLRGLGVAAVHAGRADEAIEPLEAVTGAGHDPAVRMLLAHVYDRRDEPALALAHLRAVLAGEPRHEAARRLLAKLEREQRAEASFDRETADGLVIKWPAAVSPERRRLVRHLLESARDRLGRDLRYRATDPVTVVMYADEEFRAVTGAHPWASGVFDGKIRLPSGAPERDLDRLVTHEMTHAAIHALTRGRAPRWLHEGVAQAMEGVAVDPMLRVPASVNLAGVETLITDPDPLRARTGYDLSVWIARDLLDRGGTARLADLLERLGAGEPLDAAFTRVYGLPLAELESQWRRLLGG
ncbi:MAG: tetratricopeptide repeat protein [Candidatus Rokubacteria bacterium]|nr:tetratricopeptide repeat protein [Candidatus Rokubacteria bacterium]